MKPDGVTMETTEHTEAAGVTGQSSSQDNVTEQAPSQPEEAAREVAPKAVPKSNIKLVAAGAERKTKAVPTKTQATVKSTGSSGFNSRPGPASHRTVNDVKSINSASSITPKKTAATKTSTAAAVPKRPLGGTAVSTTVKNPTRMPDKKPLGANRTTSIAATTATNGTKPITMNGTSKKPVTDTGNVARPKPTGAASRPGASPVPKPTTSKAGVAISKTTRPTTVSSSSRPVTATSRPTSVATRPSTNSNLINKSSASKVTTATSAGKPAASQPSKTAAAKKDVSRPPSAAGPKRPATTSTVTKKPEPSKPAANVKLNSVSKLSTTAKPGEKTQHPVKPASKKPAAAVKLPTLNKTPFGRTPPASPANKTANVSCQPKRGPKPTQAVPPFTADKKTVSETLAPALEVQSPSIPAVVPATALSEQAEATATLPQESGSAASTPEEVSSEVLAQEVVPQEPIQNQVFAPSSPQITTALLQTCPAPEQLESTATLVPSQKKIPVCPEQTRVASTPNDITDQLPSTSNSLPAAANVSLKVFPHTNLNEEEDEEEREGSQLVSVSEMSGTTQPTEESRPGSAGLVGGSAWRASGALLSELDSEDVSGSQQGASELSAPGVLEGTESMDDLGDGSLKGAIDIEGASAGSPDFEKVPDIPANDYDDDEDDDDNDRVCDMDVGSEQTDEPQRPRHDNDIEDDDDEEEEEDDDVEMASEGVTESGLESYGNADEDDFAEDERIDNLNRVVHPPPPPPMLPSAPGAQWDQPNPFADPWTEPNFQPHVFEHLSLSEQMAEAAAQSPLADPWQGESETPTQTPAQTWLELGSASCASEKQEVRHHSIGNNGSQDLEDQINLDQSGPDPTNTVPPAHFSAPAVSHSSALSSGTSTPDERCNYNQVEKLQSQDARGPVLSSQLDLVCQNLGIDLETDSGQTGDEEAEAETLPADDVLGGPATAPTSNPSSSSDTEEEASDTEGEAQLGDSLESSAVRNMTFDGQPAAQRCLSTVEEGEEAEVEDVEHGVEEDTTPPSATSLASYGFDTMTTTSNSHAQSTGEGCIKSPGVFSLEELPEESKEPCFMPQPCLAEEQYIECGKQETGSADYVKDEEPKSDKATGPVSALSSLPQKEEIPDEIQPPYYSAICEKTENFYTGFTALPHPHRRDHLAHPRAYCDIIKPHSPATTAPKLTCADLPPRSPGQGALSPQLRRLEQHQRQLLELQQRREQQSRPLEEAEQERKKKEEEEQRKKKEEAEEEIKRNREEEERVKAEEELKRKNLELQLQQQQQELKERQQIMQWQQELEQSNKGQTVLLSPSSGLCTIYEALESSEEEAEGEEEDVKELNSTKIKEKPEQGVSDQDVTKCDMVMLDQDVHQGSSSYTENPAPHPDCRQTPSNSCMEEHDSSPFPLDCPEQPPHLDLDWDKKVDIVQQLINQTLLLNRDGCSSLLLLPGGTGGTLSPLESSLWPSLLPPLTPPSATVTSVSSFSPEATGSSPQGEWTVVELETHH